MRDLPLILPPGGIQLLIPKLVTIQPEPTDDAIATSYLGTPVYSNLIFLADPDTPENADLIFDTVIMDVNQEKNVVRTPIPGRDGTVKEYISKGDYDVTINGLINSPYENVFPKDQLTALRNLLDLPKPLAVASNFLQYFSVHSIVVMGFSIGEKMGYRNEIPFTIRAVSDEPIEIKSSKI